MTREENGTAVPELARRMTLCSCELDPVRAFAAVLLRMAAAGIPLGDILDDSGYAHHGAIIANGNLYCPATPKPLLQLGPLAPAATPDETAAHDQQTAELGHLRCQDFDTCPEFSSRRSVDTARSTS